MPFASEIVLGKSCPHRKGQSTNFLPNPAVVADRVGERTHPQIVQFNKHYVGLGEPAQVSFNTSRACATSKFLVTSLMASAATRIFSRRSSG